jgi:sec-independent protein translocase protein TatA
MLAPLAFLTGMQLVVVLIVGVLIFGRRLPEIGRYLGKGIVEFKKGMRGLEDELDLTGSNQYSHMNQPQQAPQQRVPDQIRPPQRVQATAPKFEENLPNISTPPRA